MTPLGKALKIPDTATATQDAEDRYQQQQQPLVRTHLSALTTSGKTIRSGLEED